MLTIIYYDKKKLKRIIRDFEKLSNIINIFEFLIFKIQILSNISFFQNNFFFDRYLLISLFINIDV